jgi:hypothetical protein
MTDEKPVDLSREQIEAREAEVARSLHEARSEKPAEAPAEAPADTSAPVDRKSETLKFDELVRSNDQEAEPSAHNLS